MANNIPAFPVPVDDHNNFKAEPGMTLRDYFAAHVSLQAYDIERIAEVCRAFNITNEAGEAIVRYEKADAMIGEREAK